MFHQSGLLILATALLLSLSAAEAQPRRYYVDPPPEIDTVPAPTPEVEETGSIRAAPPAVVDPSPSYSPPSALVRSGCTVATYVTGQMADQLVRVHRC